MAWLSSFFNSLSGAHWQGKAKDYMRFGDQTMTSGTNYYNAAMGSLQGTEADYQKRLAAGLPEDVASTFRTEQGHIADTAARSRSSFGADLMQRARATGGRIDPQAAIDSTVDYNANADTGALEAQNTVAANEANARLSYTKDMLDAIERVQTQRLGAGIDIARLGSNIYGSALNSELERRKAIASTFASIYGSASKG